MRKIFGVMAVVVGMMVAGGRAANAQDDGLAALAAVQRQNEEASNYAARMAADAMNQLLQFSNSVSAQADTSAAPVPPPLPTTPKPTISPKGGKFVGSVQVTLADSDAKALVFYTTNGAKPTAGSARYAGPIAVAGKTKVRAMALDLDEMPSGVVAKTFKVKS